MISFNHKRILLVAAHPDDELLGCGATMKRLIDEFNCQIRVIILGEGITSRSDERDPEKWAKHLEIHRANIKKAQEAIGYQSAGIYNFADNRFDSVDLLDLVKVIEKEKTDFDPEIIFTHHGGDTNIDHRRTFEAVVTAIRPMSHEKVQTLICFETPSSTEWQAFNYPNPFLPNLFMSISENNLNAKIKGMESYEFEKRPYPHPRSPEALKIQAQRWGVAIGKPLAEAFMLIRSIIN
ncbi:MAG: PIG-L deacetylase family protein [Bacteroidia bacterium]|jgi:LmbE family N-acetylglucosaminyl deacetylase